MQLSPHFCLDEFTRSATAEHMHIVNKPGYVEIANLAYLCAHVLEPSRQLLDKPIIISSGFRSPALNKAVGGVPNSYHLQGYAADIICKSDADYHQLFTIIKANPYVDMLLYEHRGKSRWLHVQCARNPRNISNPHYRIT